jgi:hypothetical protein
LTLPATWQAEASHFEKALRLGTNRIDLDLVRVGALGHDESVSRACVLGESTMFASEESVAHLPHVTCADERFTDMRAPSSYVSNAQTDPSYMQLT